MKNFTRKVEDFVCDVCGTAVTGNGYTNHCPKCLCSKHVDVQPGDRASDCHGTMYPVGYEQKNGAEFILHECRRCGFQRKNKVAPEDARKTVIAISSGTYQEYLLKITNK